jgi:hypothetical protein
MRGERSTGRNLRKRKKTSFDWKNPSIRIPLLKFVGAIKPVLEKVITLLVQCRITST